MKDVEELIVDLERVFSKFSKVEKSLNNRVSELDKELSAVYHCIETTEMTEEEELFVMAYMRSILKERRKVKLGREALSSLGNHTLRTTDKSLNVIRHYREYKTPDKDLAQGKETLSRILNTFPDKVNTLGIIRLGDLPLSNNNQQRYFDSGIGLSAKFKGR